MPPVLGRKYTAPLNILNDLSKEERVYAFMWILFGEKSLALNVISSLAQTVTLTNEH